MWVLIGPIFGNNPQTLTRDNGIEVPIADSFYCILVDPQNYPWGPGNSDFLALEIPQQPSSPTLSNSYITTIDAIEAKTDLNFLPRLTTSQQSSVEATPAAPFGDFSKRFRADRTGHHPEQPTGPHRTRCRVHRGLRRP